MYFHPKRSINTWLGNNFVCFSIWNCVVSFFVKILAYFVLAARRSHFLEVKSTGTPRIIWTLAQTETKTFSGATQTNSPPNSFSIQISSSFQFQQSNCLFFFWIIYFPCEKRMKKKQKKNKAHTQIKMCMQKDEKKSSMTAFSNNTFHSACHNFTKKKSNEEEILHVMFLINLIWHGLFDMVSGRNIWL